MTSIAFTSASPAELTLQQRLSQCRHHYGWSGGELTLAIASQPASLDYRLQLQWQGLSLPLLCHGAELARWLAPDLQQAALFSLPESLQLALIERLGQPLGNLSCSALTPFETNEAAGQPALQLLLKREGPPSPSGLPSLTRCLASCPHDQANSAWRCPSPSPCSGEQCGSPSASLRR